MIYITYAQMVQDCKAWAQDLLPECYDTIAGIPRSGMLVASILAQELGAQLADVYAADPMNCGDRWKGSGQWGKTLIVDDSLWSGAAMRRAIFACDVKTCASGVLYLRPGKEGAVGRHYKKVDIPRRFEWNLWAHSGLRYVLSDIDGTLCPDPPMLEDKNEHAYAEFLRSAPLIRKVQRPLLGLVTCRLERYRQHTMYWAAQHQINYTHLHMMSYNSAAERRAAGQHGRWKGKVYKNCTTANIFIENVCKQARDIAEVSRKPVLCLACNELHTV